MPHAGARLAFVSEAPARRRRIDIPGSAPGSLHATHGSFRTEPRPLRAVHGPLHTPPRSFRTRREPCRTLPRPSHATPESHHAHMRPMRIRLDDIRRRAFAISDNYPRPQSAKPGSDRVVAVHYNFCSMGKTTAYVVPGGVGFGEYYAAFGCDDGVDPVARDDYALAWHGNQPELLVTGTAADPVWRID